MNGLVILHKIMYNLYFLTFYKLNAWNRLIPIIVHIFIDDAKMFTLV